MNNLTNGLVATLFLVSPIVGAETEYPAADFKPKVIYQDVESSQSKSAAAPTSPKQTTSVESTESDSKYPAADFQPKVLYKDSNYKPSKSTGASTLSGPVATSEAAISEPAAVKAEDSSMSYLIGLVALAAIGYLFFSTRESKTKVSDSRVYAPHASGLSGVARYLRKHNMGEATGVARYLEKQVVSGKTATKTSSVEKYLEKQAKFAEEKTAQAATGVEKYMRNRG
jgi:hypothetical protein